MPLKSAAMAAAITAAIAVGLAAAAHAQLAAPDASMSFSIDAAGATFPFPLIDKWRVEYAREHPNVSLNYQSIGSGGGITQHIERTVNFAATDAPMSSGEAELAPNTLHIPETLGAVVVAYNIPSVPDSGLQLDGQTVAMIFLGEIERWDDERIAAQNPGVALPDEAIVPIQRSDGSGTTFVFTDYLSGSSADFEERIGKGKSVPWPGGVSSSGNEGVAGTIRTTPHSVGYVELAYAFQTGMAYAHIENADGTAYVEPTIASIRAASAGAAASLPLAAESWEGVSIVNAPGENSYPISSLTYLLLYSDLGGVADSIDEAHAIVHIVHWMLTSGQVHSEPLLYVPLPEEITRIGTDALQFVTHNGMSVWAAAAESPYGETTSSQATGAEDRGASMEGGGCLIATAAYGTEMAPQVQALRELRDGRLLGTESGSAFMAAFNAAYYSFSPAVADLERQSPEIRGLVRALIAPMLHSLSIMSLSDGGEAGTLALGSLVIALNAGMYVAAPAAAASWAWRRSRRGV